MSVSVLSSVIWLCEGICQCPDFRCKAGLCQASQLCQYSIDLALEARFSIQYDDGAFRNVLPIRIKMVSSLTITTAIADYHLPGSTLRLRTLRLVALRQWGQWQWQPDPSACRQSRFSRSCDLLLSSGSSFASVTSGIQPTASQGPLASKMPNKTHQTIIIITIIIVMMIIIIIIIIKRSNDQTKCLIKQTHSG